MVVRRSPLASTRIRPIVHLRPADRGSLWTGPMHCVLPETIVSLLRYTVLRVPLLLVPTVRNLPGGLRSSRSYRPVDNTPDRTVGVPCIVRLVPEVATCAASLISIPSTLVLS